jgi:hypothetical protein
LAGCGENKRKTHTQSTFDETSEGEPGGQDKESAKAGGGGSGAGGSTKA